jgi:hypothetical protein
MRGGWDDYGVVPNGILFVEIRQGVTKWFLCVLRSLGTLPYLEILASLHQLRRVGGWLEFDQVLFFLPPEGGYVSSEEALW